jgi:excisionase family DNA binding protein
MEELFNTLKVFLQPIVEDALRNVLAENKPQVEEAKNLTRKQLCERWSVTLPTLYNYVREGKVKPIKIGRRVLFPESEVERAEFDGVGRYRHSNNKV